MERRKFTREFKLEAVKLVKERGAGFAQAPKDLGVHQSVLRNLVKDFARDPQQALSGHGQMKPERIEIDRLKREVTKLNAERDILKELWPTSRGRTHDVLVHREAPRDLAGGGMRGRSVSRAVAFMPG